MLSFRKYPVIYEVNTRLWLSALSAKYGTPMHLGAVTEEELALLRSRGFDALWLMGIWEPSPVGQAIARAHEGLRREFIRALPDLREKDILSSPYAVNSYTVSSNLGGEEGLRDLRSKAHKAGLPVMLDFVPNHTALDHPWVTEHPEYYVGGSLEDYYRDTGTFFNAGNEYHPVVIAHGRDPYYPAWTDTAQLNYFNASTREAMKATLLEIASKCDGVRCDMAMLILNEIHMGIWGERLFPEGRRRRIPGEFWQEAIEEVKAVHPEFLFAAEAYWMKEGELQFMGFDYTYDKALYDWLRSAEPLKIENYIGGGPFFYQERCLRFIENHDEDRAAAVFSPEHLKTAALIAGTLPGARLYHEGQLEGYRRKLPVQLGRREREDRDEELWLFYEKLLSLTSQEVFHRGRWQYLPTYSAWEGNNTYQNFIVYLWALRTELYLVVTNLSPQRSQCYVPLPPGGIEGKTCTLVDLLDDNLYERDGDLLSTKGLYLDMGPFYRHLFRIEVPAATQASPV
ncbi:MAG: alpha-amylase family glycosyl hydrolase [Candidatus Eremiobacteraeota bacterium]|nr:alpha-amylase family glycosyl hydrolase [Candidatus Eremiobacteraeota bacterium]